METHGTTDSHPRPASTLVELLHGNYRAQAVSVAARLGLADLLVAGPRDSAELAAATGADERAMHRLLRALASIDILEESAAGYGLTVVGGLLRSDVPGSLRAYARVTGEIQYAAWGDFYHIVMTGQSAFIRDRDDVWKLYGVTVRAGDRVPDCSHL
jgi:hypothetical protein